jgi:antitoxin component YwqK of YwqJK toxin-antitoxin module
MIRLKKKKTALVMRHLILFFYATGLWVSGDVYAQVFRGYYSDGSIEFKSKIDKHRQTIRGYYPGGAIEFVATYKNGKLNGITREYYENGVLKSEISYESDLIDGIAKFYYENGMLMGKIFYKKGKETGKAKFYNQDGMLTGSTSRIRRHDRRLKQEIPDTTGQTINKKGEK